MYAVGALLAFAETAIGLDLVVPGEAGMVVVGAVGRRAELSLPGLIACASVGATAGDLFSYWLGRRYGLRVLERWEWTRKRLLPKAKRAKGYFERRGSVVVFGGRWVGALRAVVPLVAGTARMPLPTFLAWNIAASISWTAVVISIGWLVGAGIADVVDRWSGWISVLVVSALALWFGWRWWRKRRAGGRS